MDQSTNSSKKTRKNKNRNKKTRRAKSNFITNILNSHDKAKFVKYDPKIDLYKLTDRDREIIRRFRQTDDKVETGLEDDTDNIKIVDPAKNLKPELQARFFPKGQVVYPPDNDKEDDKDDPVDWNKYNEPILNARFSKQWVTEHIDTSIEPPNNSPIKPPIFEDKDTSLLKANFLKDTSMLKAKFLKDGKDGEDTEGKLLKAKFIRRSVEDEDDDDFDTDSDSDYDSDRDYDSYSDSDGSDIDSICDDTENIYKAPYVVSDKECKCICDNDAFKTNQNYRYKKKETDNTFFNLSDRMKYVKLPLNQQRNYWSSVNRTNAYHENYLNTHFFNK